MRQEFMAIDSGPRIDQLGMNGVEKLPKKTPIPRGVGIGTPEFLPNRIPLTECPLKRYHIKGNSQFFLQEIRFSHEEGERAPWNGGYPQLPGLLSNSLTGSQALKNSTRPWWFPGPGPGISLDCFACGSLFSS